MRRDLPTGTVTFVFTDIEGSTRMLEELGADAYGELLVPASRGVPCCVGAARWRGGGHGGGRVLRRVSDGVGARSVRPRMPRERSPSSGSASGWECTRAR